MIVLDDQLEDARIQQAIARWYKGTVIYLKDLRPASVIRDDAVPMLLRTIKQPTFVTLNYIHFWGKIHADENYCVICMLLPMARKFEVSALLREVLRLEEYRTKRQRMGAVVSVRGGGVEEYRA